MTTRLTPEEIVEIFPEGPQLRDEHYGYAMRGLPPDVKATMREQMDWLQEVGLYGHLATSEYLDLETYKQRMLKAVASKQRYVTTKRQASEKQAQRQAELKRQAEREEERTGHWRAFPLGTPVSTSNRGLSRFRCRECTASIGNHQATIAPRERECIECTRTAFEELTSVKFPGGDSKRSETWKVDNLHLYLEQHSRSIAEGAKRELVIRPFTAREFVSKHGSECYSEGCTRLWSALSYSLSPAAGGSHSLENIRPACREHATEGRYDMH